MKTLIVLVGLVVLGGCGKIAENEERLITEIKNENNLIISQSKGKQWEIIAIRRSSWDNRIIGYFLQNKKTGEIKYEGSK